MGRAHRGIKGVYIDTVNGETWFSDGMVMFIGAKPKCAALPPDSMERVLRVANVRLRKTKAIGKPRWTDGHPKLRVVTLKSGIWIQKKYFDYAHARQMRFFIGGKFTGSDDRYIVCKTGMKVTGVICPVRKEAG